MNIIFFVIQKFNNTYGKCTVKYTVSLSNETNLLLFFSFEVDIQVEKDISDLIL